MNVRHRNAQLAGRDSVELFTLIFFNQKNETATGVIMNCKKMESKYGYLNMELKGPYLSIIRIR